MNKKIALKLNAKAHEIAEKFSHTDRDYNFNNEAFEVINICPQSETVAVVIFKKTSGKLAIAVLYYLKGPEDGYWQYFFPKESHIYGFRDLDKFMVHVERENYPLNFTENL